MERPLDRVIVDCGLVSRGQSPACHQTGEDAHPNVLRHFALPVLSVTNVLCLRMLGQSLPIRKGYLCWRYASKGGIGTCLIVWL